MVMKFIRECRFRRGTGNYHSITALGNQTMRHHWHSPRKTLRTEILLGLLLLAANKKFILMPCTLSAWMLSDQFAPLILCRMSEAPAHPSYSIIYQALRQLLWGISSLEEGGRAWSKMLKGRDSTPLVTHGSSIEIFARSENPGGDF